MIHTTYYTLHTTYYILHNIYYIHVMPCHTIPCHAMLVGKDRDPHLETLWNIALVRLNELIWESIRLNRALIRLNKLKSRGSLSRGSPIFPYDYSMPCHAIPCNAMTSYTLLLRLLWLWLWLLQLLLLLLLLLLSLSLLLLPSLLLPCCAVRRRAESYGGAQSTSI